MLNFQPYCQDPPKVKLFAFQLFGYFKPYLFIYLYLIWKAMMCKGFCCANPPPTKLFLPQPFTFYEGFKGGVGKSHGMALKWTTRAQHMKPMCEEEVQQLVAHKNT